MVCGRIDRAIGGDLSFWDEGKFSCSSSWNLRGAVVVKGQWRVSGEECCIINVYAPCCFEEKVLLLDMISLTVGQWDGINICVLGDFNAVLEAGERIGLGGIVR